MPFLNGLPTHDWAPSGVTKTASRVYSAILAAGSLLFCASLTAFNECEDLLGCLWNRGSEVKRTKTHRLDRLTVNMVSTDRPTYVVESNDVILWRLQTLSSRDTLN